MQSGIHAAIIMDGNGRWANARHLPRAAGHQAGMTSVRKVIEAAPSLGITTLTLYAFSRDNWKRPMREVSALMQLLRFYLRQETDRCIRQGVRLEAIGRRDRLPASVIRLLEDAEQRTQHGKKLHVRLALDYSAREAIVEAAKRSPELTEESISAILGPAVDLLIRTSGEQRLSDFMLWESAYAEIVFTPCHWPDFGESELAASVAEFHSRERRFGAIAASRRTA